MATSRSSSGGDPTPRWRIRWNPPSTRLSWQQTCGSVRRLPIPPSSIVSPPVLHRHPLRPHPWRKSGLSGIFGGRSDSGGLCPNTAQPCAFVHADGAARADQRVYDFADSGCRFGSRPVQPIVQHEEPDGNPAASRHADLFRLLRSPLGRGAVGAVRHQVRVGRSSHTAGRRRRRCFHRPNRLAQGCRGRVRAPRTQLLPDAALSMGGDRGLFGWDAR